MRVLEVEVQLRQRNQVTLPAEVVEGLAVQEGDRLILRVDQERHTAELRPVRASYAGVAGSVYGRTRKEVADYIKRERAAWAE